MTKAEQERLVACQLDLGLAQHAADMLGLEVPFSRRRTPRFRWKPLSQAGVVLEGRAQFPLSRQAISDKSD